MITVTISLPDSLKTFIEAQLVEGLVSGGADIPLTREFWKDLKAEAVGLAKKLRDRKPHIR